MRKKTRNVYTWIIRLLLFSAIAGAVVVAEARPELEQLIKTEAKKHGLDDRTVLAIARVESGLNPRAIGAAKEVGLFQLRPEYFGASASKDPRINTRAAAAYLAWLRERPGCAAYGRYWYVCYNRGPNRFRLTNVANFDYVIKVERARAQIKAERAGRQVAHQD